MRETAGAMSLLTATLISSGLFLQDSRLATWSVPLPSRNAEEATTAIAASVLVLILRLRRLLVLLRLKNGGEVTVSSIGFSDRSFDREPGANGEGLDIGLY